MKRTLLLVGVAVLLIAADDKADAKEGKAKLQGTWVLTSGERGGQALPEEFAKGFKLTFKGDRFIVVVNGMEIEGDLKVDESKKPTEIEFKGDDGARLGIFSFDGDKLKLCVNDPGADRPKEFASKDGSTAMYFVMKKEAAKPK